VKARCWPSAEAFLGDWSEEMRGCLVLDVRMEGMSGVELLDQLLARECRLPVIFLTGHGDVPLAVAALKKGAFDFVEKPFNDNDLVDRIVAAMRQDASVREEARERGDGRRARGPDAARAQVMERVLAGDYNKTIADALGIAVRTVEVTDADLREDGRPLGGGAVAAALAEAVTPADALPGAPGGRRKPRPASECRGVAPV
jgi:two-component system response regulator DctR